MTDRKTTTDEVDKLNGVYSHMLKHSPFYRDFYKRSPSSLSSLEDFQSLPFISKKVLQDVKFTDRLCVDMRQVREIHYSSGTTANPIIAAYTSQDLRNSREHLSETWKMQGVEHGTRFAMLASYGLFSAGLINHYAIQHAGGFTIPISSANLEKIIKVTKELNPEMGAAVSSFYMFFIERLRLAGVDPREIGFKRLIAGGEYLSESQRKYIEKEFDALLLFQYGLAEIDTGIAGECSCQNGLHLLNDYTYAEIIDPETEKLLSPGDEGELVLSHMSREATPLLRYRTGDITRILPGACPCGRTALRIAPIKRRVGDSLTYKGSNIDLDEFESILEKTEAMKPFHPHIWQLRLEASGAKRSLELKVFPLGNEVADLTLLSSQIRLSAGANIAVSVFTQDEFSKISEGKLKKFIVINQV